MGTNKKYEIYKSMNKYNIVYKHIKIYSKPRQYWSFKLSHGNNLIFMGYEEDSNCSGVIYMQSYGGWPFVQV